MRVIAGEFRSRLLMAPRGTETRPTSDRLRETLFNVIAQRVNGSRFADLYAGSGAVGIEAISRGAEFVWFAENAPAAVRAIKDNLSTLKIGGGYAVEDRGVSALLRGMEKRGSKADLVYLDPPYEEIEEYQKTLAALAHGDLLAEGALVITEHQRKAALAENYGGLQRTRILPQGDIALSFYSKAVKSESVNRDE